MADTPGRWKDKAAIAVEDIDELVGVPITRGSGADGWLYLDRLATWVIARLSNADLPIPAFWQLLIGGTNNATEVRDAIDAEQAGTAQTLIDGLSPFAQSGDPADFGAGVIGISVIQATTYEQAQSAIGASNSDIQALLVATTQAGARAAIGAAAGGGSWRYFDSAVDGVQIDIFDTDTNVLIYTDGIARLRLSMPAGAYDTQEIRIASTTAIDELIANYGADVLIANPATSFPGGFGSTFVWDDARTQWVRFG